MHDGFESTAMARSNDIDDEVDDDGNKLWLPPVDKDNHHSGRIELARSNVDE